MINLDSHYSPKFPSDTKRGTNVLSTRSVNTCSQSVPGVYCSEIWRSQSHGRDVIRQRSAHSAKVHITNSLNRDRNNACDTTVYIPKNIFLLNRCERCCDAVTYAGVLLAELLS